MSTSCKQATELIEKRSFVGLTVVEKVRLRYHLYICTACLNYGQQSVLIDKFLKSDVKSKVALPKDMERIERIVEVLKKS